MTKPPIRGLRYRKSDATKAALDLERYANELGLTQKQRLWCQEMVMRCDGNASAAAKAAGVSLSSAGDYTANPRLQTFMQALRAAASGPVAEELELVLYEAAHSLARLTEIAEGRVPSEVKRSVPLMPNGEPVPGPQEPLMQHETYGILEATTRIFDYYHPPETAPVQATQNLVVNISSLPPEQQGPARAEIKERVLQMLGPKKEPGSQ
jgi:hypothetical protein